MNGIQQEIFQQPKLRRNNGQFCTSEQLRIERVKDENKLLRLQRDRYYRMYEAVEKDNERLTKELAMLKAKIKGLM